MYGPSGTPHLASVTPKSVALAWMFISLAGSNRPSTPIVVLMTKRLVALPASLTLACSRSLAIVIGDSTFAKKLLTRRRVVSLVILR